MKISVSVVTFVLMVLAVNCGSSSTGPVTDDTVSGDVVFVGDGVVADVDSWSFDVSGVCLIPKPSQCKNDADCKPGPCQGNGECVTAWKGEECARFCEYEDFCPGQACYKGQCCIPNCDGKECGDDGCGGSCGVCSGQEACTDGVCVCQPYCVGKDCGPDGCGGSCGVCEGEDSCIVDECVCQPNCTGKECGPDGCGGLCGAWCPAGYTCFDGKCVCQPYCKWKECGSDGCSGSCGACIGQYECVAAECVCQPDCVGKECGSDGCGGLCGVCPKGPCKADGTCVCIPTCKDKKCGDDGCGGSCGTCTILDEECVDYKCQCVPDCTGKNCGLDGCNGSCGKCGDLTTCYGGICVPSKEQNCADATDNDFDGLVDCEDWDCVATQVSYFHVTIKNDPDLDYCECNSYEPKGCLWGWPWFYEEEEHNPGAPEYVQKVFNECTDQTFVWIVVDEEALVEVDNTKSPFPLEIYIGNELSGYPPSLLCTNFDVFCEDLAATDGFKPWDMENVEPDYKVEPFGVFDLPETGECRIIAIHWEYDPLAPP